MIITSNSNPQIKRLSLLQTKASARREDGLFVVEGTRIFNEIPQELLEEVYVSEGFTKTEEYKAVAKIYANAVVVSDNVFKSVADTINPQGILAVVKMRKNTIDEVDIRSDSTILILDSLRDPGNMGTIIRTAEGASVAAIIMNKECVDIYNPKVTRSTMGSIFRVHIVIADDLCSTIDKLKARGVRMFAAHLKGNEYYNAQGLGGRAGIMIGNEANGLSDEVTQKADELIRIPMGGKLESLNAAVSAAILMYEAGKAKVLNGKNK